MSSTAKILLVHGGEPSLSLLLAEQLEDWEVRSEGSLPSEARAALLAGGEDRAAYAALLRTEGMVGPIFSLGEDMPLAPLIGLPRPFRVNALLSHLGNPETSWIDGAVIGPWRLDTGQKSLVSLVGDKIERLTDKELALLKVILVTLPSPVDRETLQTEIWRYHAEADTHTVETHVWRLRQKLEADPGNPKILVTAANGYTLKLA